MTVLLSHGYFLEDDLKEQEIMKPYPPLGILYISAWLKQHGISCLVYDTTFSSKEAFRQYLLDQKPRLLALYTNLMTKLNVLEIIKFVRSRPELEDVIIVLGGPEVTHSKANFLKAGADVIAIGEGEETMLDLARCMEAGNFHPDTLSLIPGIAFADGTGNVVTTAEREKLKDIDLLPIPDRKAIDLTLYLDAWKKRHGSNAASISTMRGCPYTCKWCSRAVYGLSYRRRSPSKVVEEMKWIRDQYNPDTLWFVDDVFTVSHKWLKEFAELVESEDIRIPFECITRADRMNEDVIQLLKKAGCYRVWIGAESGSQRIIDAMDRRVKVTQVRDMIILAKQYGIQSGTFIMLGYPGETVADIEETIHHLKVSAPDLYTITLAYPIKGTELYEEVEGDFLNNLPWESSTDRQIEFKRSYSKKFYARALTRVNNEVAWSRNQKDLFRNPVRVLKFKGKSELARLLMWWEKRKGH